jgi:hypothetical protein
MPHGNEGEGEGRGDTGAGSGIASAHYRGRRIAGRVKARNNAAVGAQHARELVGDDAA